MFYSPVKPGQFNPDQGGTGFLGHRLAAVGIRAVAPDRDQIVSAWFAKAQIIPRQSQNTPDPALAQKPGIIIENPPGLGPGGLYRVLVVH